MDGLSRARLERNRAAAEAEKEADLGERDGWVTRGIKSNPNSHQDLVALANE